MNSPNKAPYKEWLHKKRQQCAPDAFTENVMQAVSTISPVPSQNIGQLSRITFWAKAAIFILATVIGFGRYAVLLFCPFFSN